METKMKSNTHTFMLILGLLSVVILSLGLTSAATFTITDTNAPSSINQSQDSFTFTFNVTYTGSSENMDINFSKDSTTSVGVLTIENAQGLNGSEKESVILSGTVSGLSNENAGQVVTVVINGTTTGGSTESATFSVNIVEVSSEDPTPNFCRVGSDSLGLDLEVRVKNKGVGEEDEWYPLDTIEVQVRLSNDLDDELRDVIFRIGLFEEGTTRNIIEDMMWISSDEDEYDVGDVEDGRTSSRHTFEFRINPEEVKFDQDYHLVVKAYPDGDESETCIDFSEGLAEYGLGDNESFGLVRISSEGSGNEVVIDDYELFENLIITECGRNVVLNADIYNIGDKDFEDQIKVTLYNKELGIDTDEIVMGDLYPGDKTYVSFNFDVPKRIDEKVYPLSMMIYYDYDDRDENYDEISEETFTAYLKVEGNCEINPPAISASQLTSTPKIGEQFEAKLTVANLEDTEVTYIISAEGYEDWAEGFLAEPSTLTVPANSVGEVIVKLTPTVEGSQTFDAVFAYDGQTLKQPVNVNIVKQSNFLTGAFSGIGENVNTLYAIAIILLILIIIIVILIVRLASIRKEETTF